MPFTYFLLIASCYICQIKLSSRKQIYDKITNISSELCFASRSDPEEKVPVNGGAGSDAVVAREGAALQVRVVEGPADAHSPEGVCEGFASSY